MGEHIGTIRCRPMNCVGLLQVKLVGHRLHSKKYKQIRPEKSINTLLLLLSLL